MMAAVIVVIINANMAFRKHRAALSPEERQKFDDELSRDMSIW